MVDHSSAQINWFCLLLPLVASSVFLACEEEEVAISTRPVVVQSKEKASTSQNHIDLTPYHQAGNGPTKAPDWISSQDLSLMRRYSLNAPTGFRNGNEFTPKGLWIERREAGWVLVMSEHALAYPTQLTLKGQRVEILLDGTPSGQFQVQVSNEDSKASWRIPASSIAGKTKLWDAKSEYSLELLQWFVKDYNPKGSVFQQAGKASGRLMIQFVDDQNIHGWLVGKSDNIRVRYMGDPNKW